MARPTTPLIDPGTVVKVALQMIDSDGLEGFSVRRLADQFNVHMASLYHHFPGGKDELLRAVCAEIIREIPPPDERAEDWADLVVATALGLRRLMDRHRNALPLVVQYQPQTWTPGLYESFRRLLETRGVPADMVPVILEAFDVLVLGSAAVLGTRRPDEPRSTRSARQSEAVFEHQCRTLAEGFRAEIRARAARTHTR